MKIVTYARVSTVGQERKGQSLPNQERAFCDFIDRGGHVRLKAYQESGSGGSIEGRAAFSQMLSELATIKPEAVVVDTLDRFTRNLRQGLNVLEELRGHHVGLLPIDWRREKPIDLNDDRDWADVADEFTGAERERRRIRRRVLRAYEGRRERGATTVFNPALGLRKAGDRLEPDPDKAWIVSEMDRRLLEGQSRSQIELWIRNVSGGKVTSRDGVFNLAKNRSLVEGGVRTAETQARLDAFMLSVAERHGHAKRKYEHALTGIILCGRCLQNGRRHLMPASWSKKNGNRLLLCRGYGHQFCISVDRMEPAFVEFLTRWQAPATLERWEEEPAADESALKSAALQRRLSDVEQREAKLKTRRDAAFDLAADRSRAVASQARKALLEIEQDERALSVERQALTGELSSIPAPRPRDPNEVRELLNSAAETYWQLEPRERNELARALCTALGSNPRVDRQGRKSSTLRITWPELAAFEVTQVHPRIPSRGVARATVS